MGPWKVLCPACDGRTKRVTIAKYGTCRICANVGSTRYIKKKARSKEEILKEHASWLEANPSPSDRARFNNELEVSGGWERIARTRLW